MKENYYSYQTKDGKCSGAFNIYQSRVGAIVMVMGSGWVYLTLDQLLFLEIPVRELVDFDADLFNEFYRTN